MKLKYFIHIFFHPYRLGILALLGVFCLAMPGQAQAKGRTRYDTVSNAAELQAIFQNPVDSIVVYLKPGDYHLTPKTDYDTSVENKDGVPTYVKYTYGLRITAKFVTLKGPKAYGAAIYTHAGYGIYFEGCRNANIEGLIISGGVRDSHNLATDAAIVVRNSKVRIIDNIIFENLGADTTIAKTGQGIIGICGRENSYCFIFNNQIARNSYHGIAMLKGSKATITGNLIDGVDESPDPTKNKGGQGTGIFLTRDSKSTVESNVVKRYKSGIAVWVNADALVSDNLVENIKTWGISVFDADTGKPKAHVEKNIIYKTGGCGAGIRRYLEGPDPGYFRNNIMVETAQNRKYDAPDQYCYQCALAVQGRPDHFEVADNLFYKNFWLAPCYVDFDMTTIEFAEALQARFSTLPLQWYAGYSEFVQRFYLYAGKSPQQ